jgi:hypothetical protein
VAGIPPSCLPGPTTTTATRVVPTTSPGAACGVANEGAVLLPLPAAIPAVRVPPDQSDAVVRRTSPNPAADEQATSPPPQILAVDEPHIPHKSEPPEGHTSGGAEAEAEAEAEGPLPVDQPVKLPRTVDRLFRFQHERHEQDDVTP